MHHTVEPCTRVTYIGEPLLDDFRPHRRNVDASRGEAHTCVCIYRHSYEKLTSSTYTVLRMDLHIGRSRNSDEGTGRLERTRRASHRPTERDHEELPGAGLTLPMDVQSYASTSRHASHRTTRRSAARRPPQPHGHTSARIEIPTQSAAGSAYLRRCPHADASLGFKSPWVHVPLYSACVETRKSDRSSRRQRAPCLSLCC